ncbi:neurofilament heavy polypeptide [Sesbania bispinosa]|nr:neurofilament heavy polypeptide [Sesbania bispinosa]
MKVGKNSDGGFAEHKCGVGGVGDNGIGVTQVGQKPADKDAVVTAIEGHGGDEGKSPTKKGQQKGKEPCQEKGSTKELERQEKGKEPCQENVKSPTKELRRQKKGKEPCQGSHNMNTRSMSPTKTGTAEGCHLRSRKQISRPDVGEKSGEHVDGRAKGKGKAVQKEV